MFGRKKDQAEMDHAKDVGRQIGAALTDHVNNYCSRIVYIESSVLLLELARELDALPSGDWLDDEFMKPRFWLVGQLTLKLHDRVPRLKQQLRDQLAQRFDTVLHNNPELQSIMIDLVQTRFAEQVDAIVAAAGYLAGVSGRYIAELAERADKAKTASG